MLQHGGLPLGKVLMGEAYFEIIETPAGKYTLRWPLGQETFDNKPEAMKGMKRVIAKEVSRYDKLGNVVFND